MSSRARQRRKRAEERASKERADSAPPSVAVALGCLAAFVGLRGSDLWEISGAPAFWGTLATIALPAVFAVGLMRGDRLAWQASRLVGAFMAAALLVAPLVGHPASALRLVAMAAALAGMVAALSLPSARAYYDAKSARGSEGKNQ